MKLRLAVPLLLAVMSNLAVAGEVTKTPPQYLILRPAKPVVIDGKLNEWDMAATPYIITVDKKGPLTKVFQNNPENPVKGDADLSGRAALAWDEQYLYVAGEMTDDNLLGVKPDSKGNQGPPGWGCDSLMVAVASFRQPMKTNSPYSRYPFLGLRYAPTGANPRGKLVGGQPGDLDKRGDYWVLTENSKWAVAETEKGYNVEAAIPWHDLAFQARPGERLFIAFLGADMDPGEDLNQVGWAYTGEPKDHPVFRLADRKDMLGILTASLDEVPADQSWAVRAELDATGGDAKLESVRVVDAKGEARGTKAVGLQVPKGMTGSEVVEFKAGEITRAGSYVVEALASAGRAAPAVVARVPLRVVAPEPEPPMVRNPDGEAHHMNPDRVPHNAWAEHREGFYRHGFVTKKDDYVPFILRHCKGDVEGTLPSQIKVNSEWVFAWIPRALALYRITGDEKYAALVREGLDVTLNQIQEAKNLRPLVTLAAIRYLTWLKDPQTPLAPKDAEARYLNAYYYFAANPPQYYFTEWGTHNRCWMRYIPMRIAMEEAQKAGKPVDPRIPPYVQWHTDRIWKMGDSDDNSAGYHWVFFQYAWQYYMHTGDWDAFLKHPEFLNTMRRYVEMVAPDGAVPQFGSCSGWPEVGMSMYVYEWMSTLTKDGRFKWSSQRIAEYYYNHLDSRLAQYHLPADTAKDNFAWAYLLADDAVAPRAPDGKSLITSRRKMEAVPRDVLRPGMWHHWLVDKKVPDKVILSSGADGTGLWGLVELVGIGGHSGELPGAIFALMEQDAGLLIGQGYYENTPEFQNILWIEDLEGLAADPRPIEVSVPAFVEDPAFTFVQIRVEPYQALPVTYTRDILFVKNGFVMVKDRAKFASSMKVRIGPCYQTRDLGPQCGANWFNTYYEQLYYTGLGLGRGIQSIRNPSWDLFVHFTPRQGRKQTVLDRQQDNPWRCSPVQLRQVWSGLVRAGQELTFTSVLLPHTPSFTPKDFLEPREGSGEPKRIEVARDDDDVTVVKGIAETDPANKLRCETWVMINDTGKTVKAGPIESDAQVAVVGHDFGGKIAHRAIVGGTSLRYKDADELAAARRHEAKPYVVPEK